MAHVTTCRFCRCNAINFDHPNCVKKYGDGIHKKIMAHVITNPDSPLPNELMKELSSKKFAAYDKYLKRNEEWTRIQAHMKKIERTVKNEIEEILSLQKNKGRIGKHNTRFGCRGFTMRYEVKVTVKPELVFG